jgi:hypothetical protein
VPTQNGETGEQLHDQILVAVGRHELWCAPIATVFDRVRRRV